MAEVKISRETAETDIDLALDICGGERDIDTGCGFLDHMLELLAFHAGYGLKIRARGDTQVDYHHITEDTAIVLGSAIRKSIEGGAIGRYGSIILPMDEALVMAAVDISGRAFLGYAAEIPAQKVGDFDTELAEEFMAAMARSLSCSLHIRQLAGRNSHHIIEAMFKALGRALRQATAPAERLASTKGVLL